MWDERSREVEGDSRVLEDRIGTKEDENVWEGLSARKSVLSRTVLWVSSQTQAPGFNSKGPKLLLQKPDVNTYAHLRWSLHWFLYVPSDLYIDARTPNSNAT